MYVDSGQYSGVILSGFISVSMHHIMKNHEEVGSTESLLAQELHLV